MTLTKNSSLSKTNEVASNQVTEKDRSSSLITNYRSPALPTALYAAFSCWVSGMPASQSVIENDRRVVPCLSVEIFRYRFVGKSVYYRRGAGIRRMV